jgi:glycerol kinase
VWQDRRTAGYCEKLREAGHAAFVAEKTGLVIDAFFSASKIRWLLDNVPEASARAERGELAFGTIDSWLVWKLTGGKSHLTDASNASRTMLVGGTKREAHRRGWSRAIERARSWTTDSL